LLYKHKFFITGKFLFSRIVLLHNTKNFITHISVFGKPWSFSKGVIGEKAEIISLQIITDIIILLLDGIEQDSGQISQGICKF